MKGSFLATRLDGSLARLGPKPVVARASEIPAQESHRATAFRRAIRTRRWFDRDGHGPLRVACILPGRAYLPAPG